MNAPSSEEETKRKQENLNPGNARPARNENEEKLRQDIAELKDSHDLLQSVFDSSFNIICVLQAVRDDSSAITDFRYLITNNSYYPAVPGKNRIGRLYSELHPGIYTSGIFAHLKAVVETEERTDFEVYYNYETIDEWFRIVALKLDDGVVMTVENISERKKAEETIKKLEAVQQHELFKATLDAQEKERKRIAESLHNGLGQILYGAKLTLNDLRLKPGDTWQNKHQQIIQDREKLITEAISETRRMSHKLIPTILEDYGLKTAIEDTCRQFKYVLNITCTFAGLPAKVEQYIEIAVYRIIQELVTNIIKHAGATQASIHVEVNSHINVMVKDNGKGFATQTGNDNGIGLKTIQGNVKMLNAKLTITPALGEESAISIIIPNKPAEA